MVTRHILITAVAAALALLAAAGCGVDYGILDGKQCDPAGGCATGYRCDLSSGRCVPEGTAPGGTKDGGAAGDAGHADTGGVHEDAGRDAGRDAAHDSGMVDDTGADPDGALDGAVDVGHDAAADAGDDAGMDGGFDASIDAGGDVGADAGGDAGRDTGDDAGMDGGFDAASDAGFDAGCVPGCPAPSAVECRSDATYVTCTDPNRNGCLAWSAETACGQNEKCTGNACVCQPLCAGKCGGEDDGCGASCPDPCNGHAASCANAVCACAAGFTGASCDRCDQWYKDYPACAPCGSPGIGCCDAGACQADLECVGGACRGTCPGEMARVGDSAVCIDRFEASKDSTKARSAAGYAPWTNLTRQQAENACLAAGKRMCTLAEWRGACRGPAGYAYPYGNAFVNGACNDDNSGSCKKDGKGVASTGARATCEGGTPGVFDMSGNVWEWVWDTANGQCALQGGSVDACNDGSDNVLLSCGNDHWTDCGLTWPALGFRCCLSR